MSVCPIELKELSGVAIDIGGTKTAVGRYEKGELIYSDRFPTNGQDSIDELLDKLTTLLLSVKLSAGDVLGVAVTGRVDQDGAWYAVNNQTLSRVDSVPLRTLLINRLSRQLITKPVILNDALAGAIAEYQFGAGRIAQRLAYVTVSTGVGAGIVLDGIPLTSPRGLVGHVGFISSRHATRECGSGRMATVESIASGGAIARSAELSGNPGLDAKQVFDNHIQGEPWATDIVTQSARAIAELCADLVAMLDIERVVIGGSVGLADGYTTLVQDELKLQPELFRPEVRQASLGPESVLMGALLSGITLNQAD